MNTTMQPRRQARDPQGRYDYERLDLMCVCGHTFGQHCHGSPHDCLAYADPQTKHDEDCRCPKFRKARKRSTK